MDRVDVVFHSTFRVKLFIADQTSVFTGLKVAPRAESQMSFESRHTCVGATATLVGALDFPLQLHLILPLPQHLLAEGREAGSGIFQLKRASGERRNAFMFSTYSILVNLLLPSCHLVPGRTETSSWASLWAVHCWQSQPGGSWPPGPRLSAPCHWASSLD